MCVLYVTYAAIHRTCLRKRLNSSIFSLMVIMKSEKFMDDQVIRDTPGSMTMSILLREKLETIWLYLHNYSTCLFYNYLRA